MIDGICLGNIMIDCANAQKLYGFYHKLLGWEKRKMFGCLALCNKGGLTILFNEVSEYSPPVWPEAKGKSQKQMHLDFQVLDVVAAVKYAESIGAVKAEVQYGGEEYVTMFDLAGHPFCLCMKKKSP